MLYHISIRHYQGMVLFMHFFARNSLSLAETARQRLVNIPIPGPPRQTESASVTSHQPETPKL